MLPSQRSTRRPIVNVLVWISVGHFACGASDGGAARNEANVSAGRAQERGAPDPVRQAVLAVEERGALYLPDGSRCDEWEADVEGTRISLVRYWYQPPDESGKRRRSRQNRTIRITSTGLALEASREWADEEFVESSRAWRNISGTVGSDLCVADPSIRRIHHDHYAIGGADIYLTRRACERDRTRARTSGDTLSCSSR